MGLERHLFCIEDPFELSHDLGRTVHAEGCDKLRREFRRAWDIIAHTSNVQQLMDELFTEAPAPVLPAAAAAAGTPNSVAAAAVGASVGVPGTPGSATAAASAFSPATADVELLP